MKKMLPILALVALSLTGCASEAPGAPTEGYVPDEHQGSIRVEKVQTPEGEITCVIYEMENGGISCHWPESVVE